MRVHYLDADLCEPFEYFCMGCGNMNFSIADITKCSDCGAAITHRGAPGELDKDKLVAEFKEGGPE